MPSLSPLKKLVAKVNTEIEALVERGDVESRDSLRRYGRRKPIRVLCAYQNHIDLYDASLDDGISVREIYFFTLSMPEFSLYFNYIYLLCLFLLLSGD